MSEHLENVKAKVDAGTLLDGDVVIESVDFVVSSDIYEAVREAEA